jgi:hypothetical protein
VALLGEDNAQFESIFRNDPPSQEQLHLAERCLCEHASLPSQIMEELGERKQKFLALLPNGVANSLIADPLMAAQGCYFFPVTIGAETLMQQHGIVAISGSAFGSDWPGSILTTLAERFSATKIGDAR